MKNKNYEEIFEKIYGEFCLINRNYKRRSWEDKEYNNKILQIKEKYKDILNNNVVFLLLIDKYPELYVLANKKLYSNLKFLKLCAKKMLENSKKINKELKT